MDNDTAAPAYFVVYSTSDPSYLTQTITVNELTMPTVVVSRNTVFVNERAANTNNTFTVSLSSQPAANLTATITAYSETGAGELILNKSTLNFTPANWNAPQMVTVTSKGDANATNDTTVFMVYAPGYKPQAVQAIENDQNLNASGVIIRDDTNADISAYNRINLQVVAGETMDLTVELSAAARGRYNDSNNQDGRCEYHDLARYDDLYDRKLEYAPATDNQRHCRRQQRKRHGDYYYYRANGHVNHCGNPT